MSQWEDNKWKSGISSVWFPMVSDGQLIDGIKDTEKKEYIWTSLKNNNLTQCYIIYRKSNLNVLSIGQEGQGNTIISFNNFNINEWEDTDLSKGIIRLIGNEEVNIKSMKLYIQENIIDGILDLRFSEPIKIRGN